MERKEIVSCLLLSVVTCGLYFYFGWLPSIVRNHNKLTNETNSYLSVLLLSLITCGIYGIYYVWKVSKGIDAYARLHQLPLSDNSLVNVLLAVFGFQLVSFCIIQSDINKIVDNKFI